MINVKLVGSKKETFRINSNKLLTSLFGLLLTVSLLTIGCTSKEEQKPVKDKKNVNYNINQDTLNKINNAIEEENISKIKNLIKQNSIIEKLDSVTKKNISILNQLDFMEKEGIRINNTTIKIIKNTNIKSIIDKVPNNHVIQTSIIKAILNRSDVSISEKGINLSRYIPKLHLSKKSYTLISELFFKYSRYYFNKKNVSDYDLLKNISALSLLEKKSFFEKSAMSIVHYDDNIAKEVVIESNVQPIHTLRTDKKSIAGVCNTYSRILSSIVGIYKHNTSGKLMSLPDNSKTNNIVDNQMKNVYALSKGGPVFYLSGEKIANHAWNEWAFILSKNEVILVPVDITNADSVKYTGLFSGKNNNYYWSKETNPNSKKIDAARFQYYREFFVLKLLNNICEQRYKYKKNGVYVSNFDKIFNLSIKNISAQNDISYISQTASSLRVYGSLYKESFLMHNFILKNIKNNTERKKLLEEMAWILTTMPKSEFNNKETRMFAKKFINLIIKGNYDFDSKVMSEIRSLQKKLS